MRAGAPGAACGCSRQAVDQAGKMPITITGNHIRRLTYCTDPTLRLLEQPLPNTPARPWAQVALVCMLCELQPRHFMGVTVAVGRQAGGHLCQVTCVRHHIRWNEVDGQQQETCTNTQPWHMLSGGWSCTGVAKAAQGMSGSGVAAEWHPSSAAAHGPRRASQLLLPSVPAGCATAACHRPDCHEA